MKQDFRRRTRNTVLTLVGAYVGIAIALFACTDGPPGAAARASAPASDVPVITDARICAATAAYVGATGDFWDQRAAIANAALNRFTAEGRVPDCGPMLSAIVATGVDPHLWQAALDAVDAVQSGSYALPDACVRADTVSPLPSESQRSPALVAAPADAPPASTPAARTHCVLSGLAFFQAVSP